MRHSCRFALSLLLFSASFAGLAQSGSVRTIAVSEPRQLLRALGSNRSLVLKKGEYRLSSLGEGAAEGGRFWLSGLRNLTLRGEDGASLVLDSSLDSLGLRDCRNVSLDNLGFKRPAAAPGASPLPALPALHAESVQGLCLDRCSFEGGAGPAIELWDCSGVSISRSSITGASSGALRASCVEGLELRSSRIRDCRGSPLLYFEETKKVLVKASSFAGNRGSILVELCLQPEGPLSLQFRDCSFTGNQFARFARASMAPATQDCRFVANGFEEGRPGTGSELDPLTGLSFTCPAAWKREAGEPQPRLCLRAPDGRRLVLYSNLTLVRPRLPAAEAAATTGKVFDEAYAALARLLREEGGQSLFLKAEGGPRLEKGYLHSDYRGLAAGERGEGGQVRARFILFGGRIHALLLFAPDLALLDTGGEADSIFASLGAGL
jgi:hypothetical protein